MGAILNALGAGFRIGLRTREGTGMAVRIGTALGIVIAVTGYLLVALA
ncbi:MAG: hypothetical protein Q8S03_06370 [Brevundimonas sp.]|nr:hypothetical protein [Brevundimonas sp.]MDP3404297.1 hypothetical protein [Brevundimonas sp.]